MNALTQSIAIRGVDLSDRLVMPPMASGKPNPDGTVSDSLVEYYKEKSQGGYLGLVITEHAFVCQQGKAHGGQLSIAREEDIPGLRRLADAIHNNGVKAVAQISHAGGAANPQDTGMEPVSASAVQSPRAKAGAPLPRAMTVGEIQAVVEAFAQAACRAQEAGFDGVELHAAHGYLLNQFYSPPTNHRTDAYTSATLAGRLRFLLEAVEAVRAAVGQEFLLAVRLGAGDDMPGGTTVEDSVRACQLLEQAGVDLLDISGGFCGPYRGGSKEQGYFSDWSQAVTVSYLLICMLPLFCAKLANTIFVDLTSYKNLMISKNKILGVMEEPEESGSMEPFQTDTHEITFDHVDFAYVPGEPVLKQATFTVPDQKLTAIVGDSGSGKSTILNLIAKYYEPTGGTIAIGGRPTDHVAAERVLEQISMVDQDVFLFDDTIRDNIRHARPDATDGEIEAACREANCDGFIRSMEKGYDTPTGENGNLLSGGERQRISIARAILKNSPILLLDEATASLDVENETKVQGALSRLLQGKTVLVIAHRMRTVAGADHIVVLDDGHVAQQGAPAELMEQGGLYRRMVELQSESAQWRLNGAEA